MVSLFGLLILAHSWYAPECCGGQDCHPVPCDQLTEDKDGIHWKNIIFYANHIYPTQDNQCHVCVHEDRGYCVYIQPSS